MNDRIQKRANLRFEMEKTMTRMSEIVMELSNIGAQDYIEATDNGTSTTLIYVKIEPFWNLH